MEPITRPDAAVDVEGLVTRAYEAYSPSLRRFARSLTRDDDLAADVVQETYARFFREVVEGRAPASVHAWLFRVARNLIVTESRHRKSFDRVVAFTSESIEEPPETLVLVRERRQVVEAELDRLSSDQRLVLGLTALGYSGRETARAVGRTELATRAMLCRARQRLRRNLMSLAVAD